MSLIHIVWKMNIERMRIKMNAVKIIRFLFLILFLFICYILYSQLQMSEQNQTHGAHSVTPIDRLMVLGKWMGLAYIWISPNSFPFQTEIISKIKPIFTTDRFAFRVGWPLETTKPPETSNWNKSTICLPLGISILRFEQYTPKNWTSIYFDFS